jgi:molybdate transport system ATP-binding protein
MAETILSVEGLQVTLSGQRLLRDVSFRLHEGDCLAVAGATGSGKTLLLRALAGLLSHGGTVTYGKGHPKKPRIAFVARQHRFNNRSNLASFYYQQRYNSADSEDAATALEELLHSGAKPSKIASVLEELGIAHLTNEPLIRFSNGEHRRFQLAKVLLSDPEWILLDNPLAGLDKEARQSFVRQTGLLLRSGRRLVIATGTDDPPSCATHVAVMEQGRLRAWMTREAFLAGGQREIVQNLPLPDASAIARIPAAFPEEPFRTALRMEGVNIVYGGRRILKDVHWSVDRGERWSLEGANGSGKSTLLSILYGDNPQAYSQPVWMFDRRRGTGESVWDVKRRIGFLSPEMHQHLDAGLTGFEVVASGLFDTAGLFRRMSMNQAGTVKAWMDCIGNGRLADRPFSTLSDGEQRLLLIARALVKGPPLLVFDEPCQGLDMQTVAWFRALTDSICSDRGKTLLFVSHYPGEIPSCVGDSALMEDGRLRLGSIR